MKGKTIIELTDVNTGEVQRIEDNNMFTNALDSIFNGVPYWFGKAVTPSSKPSGMTVRTMTPLVGNALGGLLLFPEAIDEDPSIIFAEATNKPVGIANMDGYTGTDTRRGSFNSIESGEIENGYKFVWEFGTAAANGTIKCASLTSNYGGNGYWDAGVNLLKDSNTDAYAAVGENYELKEVRVRGIGSNSSGIYVSTTQNNNLIYRIATPKDHFRLLSSPNDMEFLGEITRNGTKLIYENELWVIVTAGNISGTATVEIDKYNLDTWEKTVQSFVTNAALRKSDAEQHTCVSKGFLYLQGYNQTSVYKIDLTTPANATEIVDAFEPGTTGQKANLIGFNGGALGCCTVIEEDGTAHTGFDLNMNPVGVEGTWLVNVSIGGVSSTYVGRTAATVITPYLATINNLQNAVVKSSNQTMKVSYIVTEV